MRMWRQHTPVTNSRFDRSLAVYRHTFRHARALRFWRMGGVSLAAAGMLGLAVGLAAPRVLAEPLAGSLKLADLGNTVAGATISGVANNDFTGLSVSGAGDVNGDGIDDFLIGSYGADAGGTNRGETYLVYGRGGTNPLSGSLDLAVESQSFDSEAAASAGGWIGAGNAAPPAGWGPYGYSDSNNTAGASGSGEVGGIFERTPTRSYYADTSIGTVNGADGFSGSGELYVSAPFADNDTFVGHMEASTATGYENNHGGFMLRESNSSNFRFMARVRGDGGSQHTGDQVVTPNGAYNFNYAYDPGTRQLTATLTQQLTGAVVSTSTTDALSAGQVFTADAFGIGGGFNGAGNARMTAFVDAVSYTSNGILGATFKGIADDDQAGRSVSGAGDVNGDGLADVLIGAWGANAAGSDRGETYLVYGKGGGSPLSGAVNLADVGGTVAGATFNGAADSDQSGYSVSGAGDVNGDGQADLLIAGLGMSQGYLIYGQPDAGALPLSGSLELHNVGAEVAGVIFHGIHGELAVSGAGDVNGDGIDDILIGSGRVNSNRGQNYLVYGQPDSSPLSSSINLADVGDAVAGATFNGKVDNGFAGLSVSGAGDVNGDGLDDLLIGAKYANGHGETYLIYGQPDSSPLSGSLDLADVGDTLEGATFNGALSGDHAGSGVSGAGDVNNDGQDDIVIGAWHAPGGWPNRGESYLVYGQPDSSPLSGSLDLADVGSTLAGAAFEGVEDFGRSGRAISGAGDINDDGVADFLIGAFTADGTGTGRGENYLVYGQAESVVVGNGDYNGNGVVDAADYTIWHDTLGSLVDLRADGDGDLDVDQDDYIFWKDRFGNVVGTGSGAAVPEPTAGLLFTTGLVGLFWRRERREG